MDTTPYYHEGDLLPSAALGFRDHMVTGLTSRAICEQLKGEQELASMYQKLASDLSSAIIVLWKTDLWGAALKGSEIFDNKPYPWVDRIKAPQMLLLPNRDLLISEHPDPEVAHKYSNRVLAGVLIGVWETVITATVILHAAANTELTIQASKGILSPKQAIDILSPEAMFNWMDLDQPIERRTFRDIAALYEFMNQPFVSLESGVSRQIRRHAERKSLPVPDLRVIHLRRALPASSTRDDKPVEWTCSWLVSGHWRMQWYPSKQSHNPKYIAPFVKGPTDKPLKSPKPSSTIYKVDR